MRIFGCAPAETVADGLRHPRGQLLRRVQLRLQGRVPAARRRAGLPGLGGEGVVQPQRLAHEAAWRVGGGGAAALLQLLAQLLVGALQRARHGVDELLRQLGLPHHQVAERLAYGDLRHAGGADLHAALVQLAAAVHVRHQHQRGGVAAVHILLQQLQALPHQPLHLKAVRRLEELHHLVWVDPGERAVQVVAQRQHDGVAYVPDDHLDLARLLHLAAPHGCQHARVARQDDAVHLDLPSRDQQHRVAVLLQPQHVVARPGNPQQAALAHHGRRLVAVPGA
mmetsp:Transcript_22397/g.56306  ORF Transcript_22397/g.56306 Transcript_22397/m.56306 type:complete len:281 (+) Transcript_22397:128-970(+)